MGQNPQTWDKSCSHGTKPTDMGQKFQTWDKTHRHGTKVPNMGQNPQTWDKTHSEKWHKTPQLAAFAYLHRRRAEPWTSAAVSSAVPGSLPPASGPCSSRSDRHTTSSSSHSERPATSSEIWPTKLSGRQTGSHGRMNTRQTNTQTDGHTDRWTHKQTNTKNDQHTKWWTERQTNSNTVTDKLTDQNTDNKQGGEYGFRDGGKGVTGGWRGKEGETLGLGVEGRVLLVGEGGGRLWV